MESGDRHGHLVTSMTFQVSKSSRGFFANCLLSALESFINIKAVETDNEYWLLGRDGASVKGTEWHLTMLALYK